MYCSNLPPRDSKIIYESLHKLTLQTADQKSRLVFKYFESIAWSWDHTGYQKFKLKNHISIISIPRNAVQWPVRKRRPRKIPPTHLASNNFFIPTTWRVQFYLTRPPTHPFYWTSPNTKSMSVQIPWDFDFYNLKYLMEMLTVPVSFDYQKKKRNHSRAAK